MITHGMKHRKLYAEYGTLNNDTKYILVLNKFLNYNRLNFIKILKHMDNFFKEVKGS